MTLVKGPNGLVFDVAPSVASGLIGGGHVVAVEAKGKKKSKKGKADSEEQEAQSGSEVEEPEDNSDDSFHETNSDPADQGEQPGEQVEDSDDDSDESSTETPAAPSGNASRGDWEAYALAQGFAEEQLDGLKRDEIRALFDE
ncbi:hypothetical protein [Brevibacterium sediminis]